MFQKIIEENNHQQIVKIVGDEIKFIPQDEKNRDYYEYLISIDETINKTQSEPDSPTT